VLPEQGRQHKPEYQQSCCKIIFVQLKRCFLCQPQPPQQQQYLFAKMAGNQNWQLPIKAGFLQRKRKLNTIKH